MNPSIPPCAPPRASVRDVEKTIRLRIARGDYPVGHRLPSCEGLGRQLGANKNTVSKAYQALAAKGYTVSTPGRGTFVTRQASEASGDDIQADILNQLGNVIAQGAAIGLSAGELEALALQAVRSRSGRVEPRIGYVDCNRTEARELARELGLSLATTIEPLIVSDISPGGSADGIDILAVNIAHLRAVEGRLRQADGTAQSEIVPMVVMPTAETVTHVAELTAGIRLLILSDTEEVLLTLEGVARGVNPAILVSGLLSASTRLDDVLANADAILVTRTAQRRLGRALHGSMVIVASFKLDGQSVSELAGRRAALLQSRLAAASDSVRTRRRGPGRQGVTSGRDDRRLAREPT